MNRNLTAATMATGGAFALAVVGYTVRQVRENLRSQTELARLQTLHTVFQMMDGTRQSRAAVRQWVTQQRATGGDLLPLRDAPEADGTSIRKHADDMCRAYDILGLFDRHNMLDRKFTDEFYSVPLVLLYRDVLGAYVDSLRNGERDKTHFWELTQFYERVKCVPENHPAWTEAKEWPKDPRKCNGSHGRH